MWVTTPVECHREYKWQTDYINLREVRVNRQATFSELELKVYGEILNSMQKLYTDNVPAIKEKDSIYLIKPNPIGEKEVNGVMQIVYAQGVATAEQPKPQYIGVNRIRNPTYTNIKFNPVQGVSE